MNDDMADGPRVAIVGSGLAGLLIAQGLRERGITAVVFEKDPSLDTRPRDWTLMLHWGLDVLPRILGQDILDHFPEAFCDRFYVESHPPAIPCINGTNADTMFYIPSTGARLISRQRFRRALTRGLKIEYGKSLAGVEQDKSDGITLSFQDGTQYEADILIGADGSNSMVRRHLLGEEKSRPRRAPWVISLASFTLDDASKATFARIPHPVWHMGYGPEGMCAIAVIDAGEDNIPQDWEFSYLKLWHDDLDTSIQGEVALERFKKRSRSFCEPYRSIAEWIPEGSTCNIDQLKYWVPEPWDNLGGRITLAGDAAHGILPFRGQGLNHCLEDALLLVDTIAQIRDGADRSHLMDQYDHDACQRGEEAVLASLEEGRKKMNFELLMTSKTAQQGFAKESPRI